MKYKIYCYFCRELMEVLDHNPVGVAVCDKDTCKDKKFRYEINDIIPNINRVKDCIKVCYNGGDEK